MVQVYKNPQTGQPLITTICAGLKSPIVPVKFCTLLKPYYYSNSPKIPRFSITCAVDPQLESEFVQSIQTIEKNEGVESIIKNETEKHGSDTFNTGKVLIKFQTKETIPVYLGKKEMIPPFEQIKLEDELAAGEKILVIYDILRYTKKNTMKTEHGLSFKPTSIFYFPKEEGSNGVG